ncbi:hypothetical protein Tco_0814622 [Tanacetum coccineum]
MGLLMCSLHKYYNLVVIIEPLLCAWWIALPLLLGSAWKEMHNDKVESCSSHSFLEKQYTFHDLRSYDPPFCISCSREDCVLTLDSLVLFGEEGWKVSMALPLRLGEAPLIFFKEVENKDFAQNIWMLQGLLSGLSLSTQSLDFRTVSGHNQWKQE